MKITFWGTRGSIPSFRPSTQGFGGNTSCVTIAQDDTLLILDAGSGLRPLGDGPYTEEFTHIHLLLTHLHMDHIQGLGFFRPFFDANRIIHVWGPKSANTKLIARLNRYLSPPLFPVRIRDFPCHLTFHEVANAEFQLGPFTVFSRYVCHPGPTLGFRIEAGERSCCYLPDHEPALGVRNFPIEGDWTSGYGLAREADILIHDAQYFPEEYQSRVGWGHSAIDDTLKFARLAKAKELILFHHDPTHDDVDLERMYREFVEGKMDIPVTIAREEIEMELT